MQLAVISPAHHLIDFCTTPGSIQLCLTEYLRSSTTYAAFFASRQQDYVIMDNSAHEQGLGDSEDTLMEMIQLIHPKEVVLPDRLFFGQDTLERSSRACDVLKHHFPEVRRMVVPQGRTFNEWQQCLVGLMELDIHTVGISKDYEEWPGGLYHLVSWIPQYREIHLLGWGREMSAPGMIELALPGRVRSIDTAKPIVYGISDIYLQNVNEVPLYPKKPRGYIDMVLSPAQLGISAHNIGTLRTSINDPTVTFYKRGNMETGDVTPDLEEDGTVDE